MAISYRRGRSGKMAKFRLADFAKFVEEYGGNRASTRPLQLHERGFLGIEWKSSRAGVEITKVHPPAENAGIEVGDILESIDEIPTPDAATVVKLLERAEPDTRVKVKVRRGKKSRTFRVELCDAAVQAGLGE